MPSRWTSFAWACVAVLMSLGSASAADRPNVLMIVVDDLRPELACYGQTNVRSPNIDRLAARSLCFDRAYCQYPICNPSRTSFLTGLRPDSTHVVTNEVYFREPLPNVTTLPEAFRTSGYRTVSLGKVFHNGGKLANQHDVGRSWTDAHTYGGTKAGQRGEGRSLTFPGGNPGWCRWLAAGGTDEDQADGQIAAEAVRELSQPSGQPWLLAVGFNKPHDPFISPRMYFDLYPPQDIRVPALPDKRSPELPIALGKGLDFSLFTENDRHEFKRAYLAGISFMDSQVGKVLDALEKSPATDKTIILFFGDHGYHLGEHNWWNKGTLFEHSARVPFLFSAPGMKAAGKRSTALVELVDLYPTLCELCGVSPPPGLEGTSFVPLLSEPDRTWKKAAFTMAVRGKATGRSLRTDRWRYTEWDGGNQGVELYDQQADPDDYTNLAQEPQHAELVSTLKKQLANGWQAAVPEE